MRKCIISVALLFILPLYSNAQSKDEQEVRALLGARTDSWNNRDLDQFFKTYWDSDSLLYLTSDGSAFGYGKMTDYYRKLFPDTSGMGKLSTTILQVIPLHQNGFFVNGDWYLERSNQGEAHGSYSLVIRKVKGLWVIVTEQNS